MKDFNIGKVNISVYNFKSVELKFGINFDFLNDGFSLDIRTKQIYMVHTETTQAGVYNSFELAKEQANRVRKSLNVNVYIDEIDLSSGIAMDRSE